MEIHARFLFLTAFSISALGGLELNKLLDSVEAKPPDGNAVLQWAARIGAALSLMLLAAWAVLLLAGDPITRQIQRAGFFRYLEPEAFYSVQQRNVLTLFILIALLSVSAWLGNRATWATERWSWTVVAILLVDMALFAWPVSRPQPGEALYNPADPLAILSPIPPRYGFPNPAAAPFTEYLTAPGSRAD